MFAVCRRYKNDMSDTLNAPLERTPEAPPALAAPPSFVWRIADAPDESAVQALADALKLSPLVARLLVRRGIGDVEDARLFLDPALSDLHDPYCLPDVDKAVDRLTRALETNERIFVHGDYDADGVTSAAVCLRALTALGADVVGYVPKRTEGYDLQTGGVDRAHDAGATLILTADCGVGAITPVAYAQTLGIDVIVTDHHRPGPALPDAVAVVNPYIEGCDAPFKELCGAGVAFKVLDALVARIKPDHRIAFRNNFVDLVALGTVADVTPLRGENRILVAHGLKALGQAKKTGIYALLLSMGMLNQTLDTESISFRLGPRLNAAGRMEDADLAYRLLVTRDPDEAEQLAVQLAALHDKSREETARVTTEALEDALSSEHEGRRVLVLARPKWGKGVVGVAATRIAEQTGHPTFILSYNPDADEWHGSARTWGAFNLHQALHACSDMLGKFGGHSASAGVAVKNEHLQAFRDKMHELAADFISDEPIVPTLDIDEETPDGTAWSVQTVEDLLRLAPFGRENAEPIFASRGAVVLGRGRMGKDGNTLRLDIRLPGTQNALKAIWFKNGDWADRLGLGDDVDIAYTPKLNEFRGRVSVDLMLKDIRPSE